MPNNPASKPPCCALPGQASGVCVWVCAWGVQKDGKCHFSAGSLSCHNHPPPEECQPRRGRIYFSNTLSVCQVNQEKETERERERERETRREREREREGKYFNRLLCRHPDRLTCIYCPPAPPAMIRIVADYWG